MRPTISVLLAVLLLGLCVRPVAADPCAPKWLPGNGLPGLGSPASTAIAFDPDGDGPERPLLYVGGEFVIAGDTIAMDIAVWDGFTWSPVGSGFDGKVNTLAIFDDGGGPALFAGGDFTGSAGMPLNGVARWDGVAWQPLGAGLTSASGTASARAMAVYDDGNGPALYVGGDFENAGGAAAGGLARWDGSAWSAANLATDGVVHALHVFREGADEGLVVGGAFNTAGGIAAPNVARLSGTDWSALPLGTDGPVLELNTFETSIGPELVVGGAFTLAGGQPAANIATWSSQGWRGLGPGVGGEVRAIEAFDDGNGIDLYVAGVFDQAGVVPAENLARWDGTTWSGFDPGPNREVNDLIVYEGRDGSSLYPIGGFLAVGDVICNRIARWDGASFTPLGSGTSGPIEAFTIHDDGTGTQLYAGGRFLAIGGTPATRIARWNGEDWSPVGTGLSGIVFALESFGGDLFAGGRFLNAGGGSARRVARWDGAQWSPLSSGANNSVRTLEVFNDGTSAALYAGGDFTNVGGVDASRVARWDGTTWAPLGPGLDGSVFVLSVWDDGSGPALYAGGSFTAPASNIAKWDGANWSPVGTGTDGTVRAIRAFDDGTGEALFVAGDFEHAGGLDARGVAKWSGSAWSGVGAHVALSTGTPSASALTVFDSGSGPRLIVGGRFDSLAGIQTSAMGSYDGMSWSALDSGINFRVEDLAVFDPDGGGSTPERLIAGGNFAFAGDLASAFFAQWGENENVWAEPQGGDLGNPQSWICARALSELDTFIIDGEEAGFDPELSFAVALPPGDDEVQAARLVTRTNSVVINLAGRSFRLTDGSPSITRPSWVVGNGSDFGSSITLRNTFFTPSVFSTQSLTVGEVPTPQQRDNELRVSGSTVSLDVVGDAYIGRRSDRGRLVVEQGSEAAINGTLSVGTEPGAVGEVRVTDQNTMLLHNDTGSSMAIGQGGSGALVVGGPAGDSGAVVASIGRLDSLTVGTLPSGVGSVRITGTDSIWDVDARELVFGLSGEANVLVEAGGFLLSDTLDRLTIGARPESNALVEVRGANSRWREQRQAIGIGPGGTLNVFDGGLVESILLSIDRGGRVRGDGSIGSAGFARIQTDLFNLGEVLPSDALARPATLQVNGRYRQVGPLPGAQFEDAGVLRILLGGTGPDDVSRLNVDGEASLGGGLVAELTDGSGSFEIGDRFTFLSATTFDPGRNRFDVALTPALSGGRFFSLDYAAGSRGSAQVELVVGQLDADIDLGGLSQTAVNGLPVAAAGADFNGDGQLDLAIALADATNPDNVPGSVVVFLNQGQGDNGWLGFGQALEVTVGANPRAISIGDVDGIGGPDIAVANRGDRSVSILTNTGTPLPTIVVAQVIDVDGEPSALAFGDSLPDGGLDELALTLADRDQVVIFESRSDFGYSAADSQVIQAGEDPGGVQWGNLDNDKWDDLLIVNTRSDDVQGFFNDRSGGFATAGFTSPVGAGPTSAFAADLDADGTNDLVTVNRGGDSVSVLLGLGDGLFASSVELPAGTMPISVLADDLDNDKDLDLAVLSTVDGISTIQTLRNDLQRTDPSPQLVFAPAEQASLPGQPVLLLSGDADGDGLTDLIAINGLGGSLQSGGRANALGSIDVSSRAIQPCPGDADGNGLTQTADLTFVISNLGAGIPGASGTPGDVNGDGITTTDDVTFIVSNLRCGS